MRTALSLAAVLLLAATGCSGSKSGSPGGTGGNGVTDFAGAIAGTSGTGKLSLGIDSAFADVAGGPGNLTSPASISVTGLLKFVGGPLLSCYGSYQHLAAAVSASCGSGNSVYTLTGRFDLGTVTGTYTGPSGDQGAFEALLSPTNGDVSALCGTATTPFVAQPLHLTIIADGATLAGIVNDPGVGSILLTGSKSGSGVTLSATGTLNGVSASATLAGTMDVTAGTASGTDAVTVGGIAYGSGTWSVQACN